MRPVTDANSSAPAWSPDGSRLLVGTGPTSDGRFATSILNADGTDFHTLPLLTPGLGLICTVWSPNGKYCAAQGGNNQNPSLDGVYRVNVNNGSAVRLTSGFDIPGTTRRMAHRSSSAVTTPTTARGSPCTSSMPTAPDCTD